MIREEALKMIKNIVINTNNIKDGSITEVKLETTIQTILGNLEEIYIVLKKLIGGENRDTIAEYLVDLENLKTKLAQYINLKGEAVEGVTDGVTASESETLTELVEKVKEIFSIAEFNGILCYFEKEDGTEITEIPKGTLTFVKTSV
jgi:hypothetical protein